MTDPLSALEPESKTGATKGAVASASPGDPVFLYVEMDEDLQPDVKVTFVVTTFKPTDGDPDEIDSFFDFAETTLKAEKTKVRPRPKDDPTPAKKKPKNFNW